MNRTRKEKLHIYTASPYPLCNHLIPHHPLKIIPLLFRLFNSLPRSFTSLQTFILIGVYPPLSLLSHFDVSEATDPSTARCVVCFGAALVFGLLHLGVAVARVFKEDHTEEEFED